MKDYERDYEIVLIRKALEKIASELSSLGCLVVIFGLVITGALVVIAKALAK